MQNLRRKNETGRSMVEMLGVLAIVGVLSVGGVYGYGVAMKKHKANELLHQASMLATTISAQAMTNDGKLPETITSFGNSNYGTFSTTATDALNGKGFSITIENVDSAVCDQLKAGGMIRGVEYVDSATSGKKNVKITYYKNLATNDEEGKKSPTGENAESGDGNIDCRITGSCECWSGECWCTTEYGPYPYCTDEKPACLDAGTCECSSGDCYCTYGGTAPNNCNPKPACIDAGACGCSSGYCGCIYGGEVPNNCNPKPACVDAGTCEYGRCYFGGTYPNCTKPACLDAGTCECWRGNCYCTYGGEAPNNCNPK